MSAEPLSREERDRIMRLYPEDDASPAWKFWQKQCHRYEATVQAAEEREHHLLSSLESVRRLIEQDVPKEILLDNIRRNLRIPDDDAARGEG